MTFGLEMKQILFLQHIQKQKVINNNWQ